MSAVPVLKDDDAKTIEDEIHKGVDECEMLDHAENFPIAVMIIQLVFSFAKQCKGDIKLKPMNADPCYIGEDEIIKRVNERPTGLGDHVQVIFTKYPQPEYRKLETALFHVSNLVQNHVVFGASALRDAYLNLAKVAKSLAEMVNALALRTTNDVASIMVRNVKTIQEKNSTCIKLLTDLVVNYRWLSKVIEELVTMTLNSKVDLREQNQKIKEDLENYKQEKCQISEALNIQADCVNRASNEVEEMLRKYDDVLKRAESFSTCSGDTLADTSVKNDIFLNVIAVAASSGVLLPPAAAITLTAAAGVYRLAQQGIKAWLGVKERARSHDMYERASKRLNNAENDAMKYNNIMREILAKITELENMTPTVEETLNLLLLALKILNRLQESFRGIGQCVTELQITVRDTLTDVVDGVAPALKEGEKKNFDYRVAVAGGIKCLENAKEINILFLVFKKFVNPRVAKMSRSLFEEENEDPETFVNKIEGEQKQIEADVRNFVESEKKKLKKMLTCTVNSYKLSAVNVPN